MSIGGTRQQFWQLSFRQLNQKFQAHQKKVDRKAELKSGFFASLINCWSDKTIKPEQLYTPQNGRSDQKSEEQKQKEFEEAVAIMGTDTKPVADT